MGEINKVGQADSHIARIRVTDDGLVREKAGVDPSDLFCHHESGAWGDLDNEDKLANGQGLREGTRLMSAYDLPTTGEKVWLITEADAPSAHCSCRKINEPASLRILDAPDYR